MTPGLPVAKRVVLISPWVLSIAMVAPSLLAGLLVALPNFAILWRSLNLLIVMIDLGWIWSVYTVAIATMPELRRPAWISWVFAAPPLISAIATIFDLSMNNSPGAFLFFAAFLFCIGRTAVELETADSTGAPAGMGKTLGTAALLFFAPLGVWWLRQRLLRIANRTAQV